MKSLTKPLQYFSLASVAGTCGMIRDTEKVMPGSHSVVHGVKIVHLKGKDAEFEFFVFWVFLHVSNDSNDLV